jgi:hypothetical protein
MRQSAGGEDWTPAGFPEPADRIGDTIMTRSTLRWPLAALLGVALWAGSARPAAAQFWFSGPTAFGTTPFNFTTRYGFRVNTFNPFTGQNFAFRGGFNYMGLPPFLNPYYRSIYGAAAYGAYMAYNPPYAGYMYGGAGSYGSEGAGNPIIRQQLRMLNKAPNNGGNVGAARPAVGVNPQGIGGGVDGEQAGPMKPGAVDPALVSPTDEQILSGQSLNGLADAIRKLEAKGAKADAPLLPADLLSRIVFEGSAAADVLMAARNGKLEAPEVLNTARYADTRAELNRTAKAVIDPLAAGKRLPDGAADRLAAAVKRARDSLHGAMQQMAFADAGAVKSYLDRLDNLAAGAKDRNNAGVYVQKWTTLGATASELVRHMDKYNLRFAPAPPGHGEAYLALQRGLGAYYAALAQART